MSEPPYDRSEYLPWVRAMSRALEADDDAAFRAALKGFDQLRDTAIMTGVRKVTNGLQSALERFRVDARLIDLAQHQVPNARLRLAHVLRLTDDAAHRTMDLVEECMPLAEQVARQARQFGDAAGRDVKLSSFLHTTAESMSALRAKLSEVLLAQGYQDLSGQIIRSVMMLVDELDAALSELAGLGGGDVGQAAAILSPLRAQGPVVPGVAHGHAVGGQQDVDALLSGLGI